MSASTIETSPGREAAPISTEGIGGQVIDGTARAVLPIQRRAADLPKELHTLVPLELVTDTAGEKTTSDSFDRSKGRCNDVHPDGFFDDGSSKIAKKICAKCPIRTECLKDALARRERFGIWGGLTEGERKYYAKREPNYVLVDEPTARTRQLVQMLGQNTRLDTTEVVQKLQDDKDQAWWFMESTLDWYTGTLGAAAVRLAAASRLRPYLMGAPIYDMCTSKVRETSLTKTLQDVGEKATRAASEGTDLLAQLLERPVQEPEPEPEPASQETQAILFMWRS